MVDIQTVSITIASASVTVAAIYYVWQIRHQNKARQIDLVMKLYSEFGSKDFLEFHPIFFRQNLQRIEDLERQPIGTYVSYMMGCYFFEKVGILLHRKLIDIELVDDLFSIGIKDDWEKVKPIAEDVREKHGWTAYWEWFEYLYNEMKKREQQLTHKTA